MNLPGITLPGGFPCWLAAGHESARDPVYAHTPMRTGHTRQRRVYTTAPETRNVSLILDGAQAARFHAWFENDLSAGEASFSARVHQFGPGMGWWPARFVEPYKAEPFASPKGVKWRITAQLTLYGEPQDEGPDLSLLTAEIAVPLQGRAVLTSEARMASEIRVPLSAYVLTDFETLEAEMHIPLIGSVDTDPFFFVVADGPFVVISGISVITRP